MISPEVCLIVGHEPPVAMDAGRSISVSFEKNLSAKRQLLLNRASTFTGMKYF